MEGITSLRQPLLLYQHQEVAVTVATGRPVALPALTVASLRRCRLTVGGFESPLRLHQTQCETALNVPDRLPEQRGSGWGEGMGAQPQRPH